ERRDELQRELDSVRRDAVACKINEPLWQKAPRIEALAEQEFWIGSIETQIHDLQLEITQVDERMQAERERAEASVNIDGQEISSRALARLKPLARARREAKEKLAATE